MESGSGRGRFAPKNGVIDMVGVASSAILGHRGLPAAAVTTTSSSSFSCSSSSSFSSFSRRRHQRRRRHPLRRIRSAPHRVRRTSLCPLVCRVTFGLRAQPNLLGGRPGPPFSTNPGNEQRGSRGLLVAMATEPSPNPLDQTPIPYPSALRYPLPPPLPRRVVRAAVLVAKESLSISSVRLSMAVRRGPRIFCLLSCFFCFPSSFFFVFFCFYQLFRRTAKMPNFYFFFEVRCSFRSCSLKLIFVLTFSHYSSILN